MLRGALDAYVTRDEEQAERIISMDTRVDELYEQIKRDLIARMQAAPASIGPLVEMLLISKYVERIADHAQNVAEWVVFYIKGRYAKE
jgi:phosphate transport system protein